ncbi:hypothetical protein KCH_30230 [Kitasatospora cheerisanensis KCTC 2395]|uniref:Uncharacterized protein n=1 Tax=Kitasatospora cheerisanensis KCTC 2395 TaxID=1348663 RepID=A0A066YZ15_9ACTN|nr:hypothetical protein KCH_30230 [Kitasatospora cheerisanensis KCTC 2395]
MLGRAVRAQGAPRGAEKKADGRSYGMNCSADEGRPAPGRTGGGPVSGRGSAGSPVSPPW